MDYFVKLITEIGEQSLMEHCCKFLLLSTARPTPEQRADLIAKLDQDQRYEEMRKTDTTTPLTAPVIEPSSPPSPLLYGETPPVINEVIERLISLVEEEKDNWVKCDVYGCERWHKLPKTIDPNSLPQRWVCANNTWDPDRPQCAAEKPHHFVRNGPAPKAPRAAEHFWPAARAKRVVKHFHNDLKPCHMEALAILARRKGLTLEELYRMRPDVYIDNHYLSQQLFGKSYSYRRY